MDLSLWIREIFRYFFQQLIIRERISRIKEKVFEENPIVKNRVVM